MKLYWFQIIHAMLCAVMESSVFDNSGDVICDFYV